MSQHRVALYVLAFAGPLVLTLILTPFAARLATRFGILDHPAPNKAHQRPTPYLGGLALAASLVLVGSVVAGTSAQLLTILLGGLALGLLGFVDDRGTVGPIPKLIVEVGGALALWAVGIRAGLFGIYGLDLTLTVLWVVTVVNAVNLVDNMDGLSSGIAVIASFTFFVIAAGRGDYLVASLALALAGGSLGFLRHNFPPASIFLGDAGTLMIGFLLAAVGLQLDLVGDSGFIRAAIPVLIVGVPLFDMALVILARLRGARPIYVGGTDHSSHRLTGVGFSGRAVAFTHYAAQMVFCAIAVWLLHAPQELVLPVVLGVCVAGLILLVALLSVEARRSEQIELA